MSQGKSLRQLSLDWTMPELLEVIVSRDTPINLIDPDPEQPRKVFDEARLAELAESMAATGLAVPILLRPAADGRFRIVHGERRWRAAQRLGWETIPANVRELTPDEAHWLSLVENVQRSNLSPIEEAQAFQTRLGAGLTQAAIAQRIGKDRTYIAQKLRLLTMPPPLQHYLNHRALSEGHARQLLRIRGLYAGEHPLGTSMTAAPLVTADQVHGVFIHIRPADFPSVYGPFIARLTKQPRAVIVEASQCFLDGWAQRRQLPAWEMAAFWWASAAVALELSVVDLSTVLTHWWHILQAAIAHMFIYGEQRQPPDPKLNRRHAYDWWGYRADLRHAGLLNACEALELSDEQWQGASIEVCRNGAAYPSGSQAYGPYHKQYMAAVREEEEQRAAAEGR
jgi:ParB/RepB/Spo0J family partition protein